MKAQTRLSALPAPQVCQGGRGIIRAFPWQLQPALHIGPYEIVGWLGAGGMGEVYRARDPRLGREVAIKLIPEMFATDANRVLRFEQEARAAGQLNHPNILAVYDVGIHAGAPYVVSELLEGESLRSRLQKGALPSRKAIDYARQIAEGLAAAHDKGIVHRDVKPDNLFITSDGRVKILDFGIAKLTRPSDDAAQHTGLPTETEAGMVVGTAGYMSPEQVRGEAVDARSDIFSVGATIYEMITGRSAFTAGNSRRHHGGDPERGSGGAALDERAAGARAHRLALSGENARDAVSVGARSGVRPGGAVGDGGHCRAGGRRGGAVALAYGAGRRGRRAEPLGGRCELADRGAAPPSFEALLANAHVHALHQFRRQRGGCGHFARREVRRLHGRP